MLTSRGLGRVLGDLASMGFDARWGVLGAKDVGANHQRDRIWIVAKWRGQLPHAQHDRIRRWKQQQASIKEKNGITNTDQQGLERRADSGKQEIAWAGSGGTLADSKSNRLQRCNKPGCNEQSGKKGVQPEFARSYGGDNSKWWSVEPNILRVADGVAARVDRIKAIGNGQVPLCAATAWNILNKDIT
jgi:DNA (cytosine-5)-methyltransferase 1